EAVYDTSVVGMPKKEIWAVATWLAALIIFGYVKTAPTTAMLTGFDPNFFAAVKPKIIGRKKKIASPIEFKIR
ncbi:hypothetical protein AADX86_12390, partial [Staphylococcus epidermidis]